MLNTIFDYKSSLDKLRVTVKLLFSKKNNKIVLPNMHEVIRLCNFSHKLHYLYMQQYAYVEFISS